MRPDGIRHRHVAAIALLGMAIVATAESAGYPAVAVAFLLVPTAVLAALVAIAVRHYFGAAIGVDERRSDG